MPRPITLLLVLGGIAVLGAAELRAERRASGTMTIGVTVRPSCTVAPHAVSGSDQTVSLACGPSLEATRVQTSVDGGPPAITTLEAARGLRSGRVPLPNSGVTRPAGAPTLTVLF